MRSTCASRNITGLHGRFRRFTFPFINLNYLAPFVTHEHELNARRARKHKRTPVARALSPWCLFIVVVGGVGMFVWNINDVCVEAHRTGVDDEPSKSEHSQRIIQFTPVCVCDNDTHTQTLRRRSAETSQKHRDDDSHDSRESFSFVVGQYGKDEKAHSRIWGIAVQKRYIMCASHAARKDWLDLCLALARAERGRQVDHDSRSPDMLVFLGTYLTYKWCGSLRVWFMWTF